ncbi:MAG TPA: gamma-glutamyltransferase [Syntrophorhabdaceae bacterium]|nr:gamma-glutamyltransferase [Syntrophorhabdaceae bacterium]
MAPAGTAFAEETAIAFPVQGKHSMVVTGQDLATKAALKVLKKGGNAVDAAVTAAFVMAVTLPRAGNIGGGGFMLIYDAKKKEVVAIDFWQRAPGAATRTMFVGRDGRGDPKLSRESYIAVAVPGTVAGLAFALKRNGTITLAKAMEPAIRYAQEGFVMNAGLSADIKSYEKILRARPDSAKIFFKPSGGYYEAGDRFVQRDLARTLKAIAMEGPEAFYRGDIADRIARQMKANGGLLTKDDLVAYSPVVRSPVHTTYRGDDVYSMYPPSSGGVCITQVLNILEGFDLARTGHNSAATLHLVAEAMKRAFADLFVYAGDPDAVAIPVRGLTSKSYAAKLRSGISASRATASKDIRSGDARAYEKDETTHFSVVDREGNAVSSTYTLNGNFGSGIVVEGAGFLLNNEMDNFNANPGKPDDAGIIQGDANAIAPNKRMITAMTPTMVFRQGKLFLVTGSPGSSRIISTVLQVIMNVIDHKMNIQEAVNAPKVHHEWMPDELRIEKGISPDTIKALKEMGHNVVLHGPMGAATSILVDPVTQARYGAADPRREGLALGY